MYMYMYININIYIYRYIYIDRYIDTDIQHVIHGALGPPHLARQRRVRCVHLLAMLVRRQVFLRVCFRP